MTQKLDDKNLEEIKKIGHYFEGLGNHGFREVWIMCGNTVNDFDFAFENNVDLRKVMTNMDLTQLKDFDYKHVWLLDMFNFDVTNDSLTKIHKNFKNTRLMCVHARDEHGLNDDQKTQIKTIFEHVDRAQECRKF